MVKRTKARKKSRKRKSRKRQKGGCGCAMSGGGLLDGLFWSYTTKDNKIRSSRAYGEAGRNRIERVVKTNPSKPTKKPASTGNRKSSRSYLEADSRNSKTNQYKKAARKAEAIENALEQQKLENWSEEVRANKQKIHDESNKSLSSYLPEGDGRDLRNYLNYPRKKEPGNYYYVRGGKKKKTKRKNRRKYRKTKKSKRKSKKKRRRKRQRGGSSFSCNYPKNLGAHFGNKLNASPFLPDPINSNSNIKSSMKGGGLWSDVKQYWWKGNNAVSNTVNTYKGHKHNISPDPMVQKLTNKPYDYSAFNFAEQHNTVSDDVAKLI